MTAYNSRKNVVCNPNKRELPTKCVKWWLSPVSFDTKFVVTQNLSWHKLEVAAPNTEAPILRWSSSSSVLNTSVTSTPLTTRRHYIWNNEPHSFNCFIFLWLISLPALAGQNTCLNVLSNKDSSRVFFFSFQPKEWHTFLVFNQEKNDLEKKSNLAKTKTI